MGVGNAGPATTMKLSRLTALKPNHPTLSGQPLAVGCRPSAFLRHFMRDETAVTSLEYALAALAIALGAVVGSRMIAGVLCNYLHRIYVVVTLPIP